MKQNDQPAKILIVDDEPQIIRVLKTALSTQGYSIRTSLNGLDGLIAFREWNPDVVITDLSMHEMSGIELCRSLAASGRRLPTVLMSGSDDQLTRRVMSESEAVASLFKPFDQKVLLRALRKALRSHSKSTR